MTEAIHEPSTARRPQAIPRPAVPLRVPAPPRSAPDPLPVPPVAPDWPSRWHLLVPAGLRNGMEALGLWQNPVPLRPSLHLEQTLTVLERYGWGRSLDFSPTGRMCIRGGQTLLERTGHVTPAARARAVDYMQQTLQEHGYHQPFFAWNDHQERTFAHVRNLIVHSAAAAHANGE